MPAVKWLPAALADIERLYRFSYDKDAWAASRAAHLILEGAALLGSTPGLGRPMSDETGRRELFMAFGAGAYVLRYLPEGDDTVVIIRVAQPRTSHGGLITSRTLRNYTQINNIDRFCFALPTLGVQATMKLYSPWSIPGVQFESGRGGE